MKPHNEIARLLLMHKADPNIKDRYGKTALIIAREISKINNETKKPEFADFEELLLKNGAKNDKQLTSRTPPNHKTSTLSKGNNQRQPANRTECAQIRNLLEAIIAYDVPTIYTLIEDGAIFNNESIEQLNQMIPMTFDPESDQGIICTKIIFTFFNNTHVRLEGNPHNILKKWHREWHTTLDSAEYQTASNLYKFFKQRVLENLTDRDTLHSQLNTSLNHIPAMYEAWKTENRPASQASSKRQKN
jgi:hypothetical protein